MYHTWFQPGTRDWFLIFITIDKVTKADVPHTLTHFGCRQLAYQLQFKCCGEEQG